jgi:predicted Zn-dependent protease with MMP-like domain
LVDVPPERFADLVTEALDGIPPDLGRLMDNVALFIDDDSPPRGLLGRYEGIPLTRREAYGGLVMPDRITIFRRAICAHCRDEDEVRRQVQVTVVHEVAHHFGIDDDRLTELGWA